MKENLLLLLIFIGLLIIGFNIKQGFVMLTDKLDELIKEKKK